MKILFIAIVLFYCNTLSYTQDVKNFEINYVSKVEKENIKNFENDSIDYFGLFISVDKDKEDIERFREEYDNLISELKLRINERSKPKKNIKLIYQYVHLKFLKKYTDENYFSDVFLYGNYNCVSATALYAMIFEDLGISYEIKETPTHVYLVAYPNNEPIKIETTDPVFGYLQINEAFQKQFVKYLTDNKIISEADLRNSSIIDLFNKYYFDENNISLTQLVGVQYSNDGIYKSIKNKHRESFNQLLKSKKFYEAEKINFLLLQAAVNILSEGSLNNIETLEFNIFLRNEGIIEIDNEILKNLFLQILKNLLVTEGKENEADTIFNTYINDFEEDTLIHNEIKFQYIYEKARLALNVASLEKAIYFLEKALVLKPNNLNGQSLYANALLRKYTNYSMNEKLTNELEIKLNENLFLKNNHLYIAFIAHVYLVVAYDYFFYKNVNLEKGINMVDKFENIYQKDKHLELKKELISKVYIEASKYYFRSRNMTKVRYYLERAIEYNPDSRDAQNRLDNYF